MAWKKYETVRISPEAKQKLQKLCDEQGITMVKGLDRLLNVEGFFTTKELYQSELDKIKEAPDYHEYLDNALELVRNAMTSALPSKPTKPPSTIIDACILYSFKQLGKKTLTRKDIKDAVITMMQESEYPTTWSKVYSNWWENYQRNKSKFELDFDNRLRRLVKDNLISNEPKSGKYTNKLPAKHDEEVQRLAIGFYPQLVIDKLAKITL